MTRERVRIALALGSNLGDRERRLADAVTHLQALVDLEALSPIYETAPRYVPDQPSFLNMALVARTDLPPPALLSACKRVERDVGRVAGRRFGPRAIDVDIVFYHDRIVDLPNLRIPHPRMAERRFVLRPLADIAPDWRHPERGQTVREMLTAIPDEGDVRPYRVP